MGNTGSLEDDDETKTVKFDEVLTSNSFHESGSSHHHALSHLTSPIHIHKSSSHSEKTEHSKNHRQRPSLSVNVSFGMPPSQVVRGRSGIITDPPQEGQVLFMLLHITNVPSLDIASESDVYCTAQVFDPLGMPKTELMHWPVRDNAKNPVWNTVRSSRQLTKLEVGDQIRFAVYDWDEMYLMTDDLIATGVYNITDEFELRPKEDPVNVKLELSPKAHTAATLAATPAVMRSVAIDSGTWVESVLSFPARAFKFINRTPEPKKPAIKIPIMDLTFVITAQRESSRANKRVFFIVNAESVADEAEMSAKTDTNLLRKLFSNIPSDHGLSINGIAQAYELKKKLEAEKKRLGEIRKKHRLLKPTSDKLKAQLGHVFTAQDKMTAELLRASCIMSSPQSRCIATAMIALQDHSAVGIGRRAMIALENKSLEEQRHIAEQEKLMSDPNAPSMEGDGIVVASFLRDIFFNRAWLDFGEKRGRDMVKRALKLLKEVKYETVNETVKGIDWVESLSRYEEIAVHPNDCWHEWWDLKPEAPRALQQRSCEALQMLRMMRDEISICVVGGKLLRYLLRDACDKEELVEKLRAPNANFTRCCVVCADFDFTRDIHSSLVEMTLMFDGKMILKDTKTKHRIRERRMLKKSISKISESSEDAPPTPPKEEPELKRRISKIGSHMFSSEEPAAVAEVEEEIDDVAEEESSNEDQIGLEDFKELLEEEPDVVIAIGCFFLDRINEAQLLEKAEATKVVKKNLEEDEEEDPEDMEAHHEYQRLKEKKLKEEAQAKLMDGLQSMEVVLPISDVNEIFEKFSSKFVDRGQGGHAKVLEDPNEVLLKIVRDLVAERKQQSQVVEAPVPGLRRKGTMKESKGVWTRSSFVGVLATGMGVAGADGEDDDKMSKRGSWSGVKLALGGDDKNKRVTSIRPSDSPERISYRVEMDRCESVERETDTDSDLLTSAAVSSPSQANFEEMMRQASYEVDGELKSDSEHRASSKRNTFDSKKIWNDVEGTMVNAMAFRDAFQGSN